MFTSLKARQALRIALGHPDLPNESKGGVAHQTHHLANILAERGHEVTMFTFSPSFDECRYTVHTMPKPKVPRFAACYAFAHALTRMDFSSFDVIHLMGDNYLLPKNQRPPVLRTMHGSAIDELRAARSLKRKIFQATLIPLETLGVRRAAYSTGVSEATRLRLPELQEVIPNGVDLRRFRPALPEEKEVAPTLLFVGTKEGRKRGQWLGDLWTREIRPKLPAGATLWTVSDEPIEGEGIVNHGRVSLDLLTELFRRAWVFCLPSVYEGFGVPYIEAMASGTAVVASPNLGAREVLGDGKWGVVASDETLAGELVSLLTDTERRETMVRTGLGRARDFDWQTVAERYEAVYEQMIARRER